jgi:hypothetical protein
MGTAQSSLTQGWAPILSPSDPRTGRAWEAILGIAQALLESPGDDASEARPERGYETALLFAYLSLCLEDSQWLDHAADQINTAIDAAGRFRGFLPLHGGICGLGWVIEHVSRMTGDAPEDSEEESDLNAEIDEAVLLELGKRCHYDLITGLTGYGTYWLERLPAKRAFEGLRMVVDQLDRSAEHSSLGTTWLSDPDLAPEAQRDLYPRGGYNLGVAHGIPGVIQFLAETWAAGVEVERTGAMLEGAVKWLIAHQRPRGSLSRFGSWIVDGQSTDSRLAWCYGDLGIAAVLQQAALRTSREDWAAAARDVQENCCNWPIDRTGVKDASLCHGTAGAAHIFNRMYQGGGDPRCRDAALTWIDGTLAMRQPAGGISGFLYLKRPNLSFPIGCWEASTAFLEGATGVALSLLGAVTSVDPAWDRLILLSGRPSPAPPRQL